ncbi:MULTISPECIES: acyltransferase [unclassified Novosphingobium]|uniref:acyltransferase family protein n=1 Tax=unclassified Novosphingobium TaxID=2644732 RepID=UPI000D31F9D5|nr:MULTISPECIES: acyltransferase [unclassified Novosphingobium]PTR11201.1 peptidoglycan/LPS O-acetylase OafA/YrhL [Novosphingobium sp. GV055]PUB03982.1 peptidoglycan/LPS O-acetylase OafA/YrhL [Novosphingobium sp. GV061]PUB20373.1 peptidoglycan/LPS O-acetylase OafA/YrhL [Novosphingobium sp. GV079]PUB42099.1 peptidoglycan/LPS O-acetylase OafA/YrhL [Novosphingobium sp. GV027]
MNAAAGPAPRPAPLPGLRLAKRHFNALDLSRVIAAFFVLFWHYQHFFVPPVGYGFHVNRAAMIPLYHPLRWLFDYGHMAVQYFWAVSGFVFAHVYFADSTAMQRFWLARVARLWPLHLLTLVLVAGLQAIYTHINGTAFIYHEQDWKHFLLSIPLAHYWGWQHNQSFNGPSWSLSTEILAYAAFWVLLPAMRRAPLLVSLPVAVIVLRLFFLGWPDEPVLTCIGYFFMGVAVYAAALRGWLPVPVLLGSAVACVAAAWIATTRYHAEDATILAGTFAVLFATLAIDLADKRDLLAFGRQWGEASYGIYLWHFPMQVALVLLIDATLGSRAIAQQPAFLIFFLVAAVAAGFASHRWIERPAQKAVLRWAGRWSGKAARA